MVAAFSKESEHACVPLQIPRNMAEDAPNASSTAAITLIFQAVSGGV